MHLLTDDGHSAFLSPLCGLGAMYTVCLGLIGMRVVDFLFVLIELFSLGVTAQALRANMGPNTSDFAPFPSVFTSSLSK